MVGQDSLSSGPSGLRFLLPSPPAAQHPSPLPTILILIKSQGQMGAGCRKRDHSESTLKWQQNLGVTAVSPEAWPVPHVQPVSARPGLKQISGKGEDTQES